MISGIVSPTTVTNYEQVIIAHNWRLLLEEVKLVMISPDRRVSKQTVENVDHDITSSHHLHGQTKVYFLEPLLHAQSNFNWATRNWWLKYLQIYLFYIITVQHLLPSFIQMSVMSSIENYTKLFRTEGTINSKSMLRDDHWARYRKHNNKSVD